MRVGQCSERGQLMQPAVWIKHDKWPRSLKVLLFGDVSEVLCSVNLRAVVRHEWQVFRFSRVQLLSMIESVVIIYFIFV